MTRAEDTSECLVEAGSVDDFEPQCQVRVRGIAQRRTLGKVNLVGEAALVRFERWDWSDGSSDLCLVKWARARDGRWAGRSPLVCLRIPWEDAEQLLGEMLSIATGTEGAAGWKARPTEAGGTAVSEESAAE